MHTSLKVRSYVLRVGTHMTVEQMRDRTPALVAAYDAVYGASSFEKHLTNIKTMDDGLTMLDRLLDLKNARGDSYIITSSLQSRNQQSWAAAYSAIKTIADRTNSVSYADHGQAVEQVYKEWSNEDRQNAFDVFEINRRIYRRSKRNWAWFPPSTAASRAAKWNIRMISYRCHYSSSLKSGDRVLERAALAFAFGQNVHDPEGSQEQQMIIGVLRLKALSQRKPDQSLVAGNGLIGPTTGVPAPSR